MQLIAEGTAQNLLFAESNYIGEGASKQLYLEGIFTTGDNVNKNGRNYPMSILEKEINRYNEEMVLTNRAAGELNHPASASINPDRTSHRITEIHKEGKDFIGKALVLENDMGAKIHSFIKGGLAVGVSTRALGTVTKTEGVNVINDDLNLICVDVVMNPSNQTSFVNGVLEGIDFIMENGVLTPHKVAIEKLEDSITEDNKEEVEQKIADSLKEMGETEEEVERIKQEVLSAKAFELAEKRMNAFDQFMKVITR